jgi:mannitol/fructose-specific phosphotransferase system IIA component (Ntr-type)
MESTTAIGMNVAIPHAKSDVVKQPIVAVTAHFKLMNQRIDCFVSRHVLISNNDSLLIKHMRRFIDNTAKHSHLNKPSHVFDQQTIIIANQNIYCYNWCATF